MGCELPVGFDVTLVAIVLPGGDLLDQHRLVGNAAIETLGCQNSEFGLRHVEPTSMLWRVMPFEALAQPARFGGGEGGVKRGRRVRREIVLHQHDLRHVGKMRVGQILERVGVIDGGVAVGDLDVAPAFQRREHHEQIGDAVAFVFVIVTRLASGRGGNGRARLDDHLLRGLVEAHHGPPRIMRSLIDFQHVFHVGDETRAGMRRDHPLLFEMRLENVFLSVRPIVLSLAFSTMFNSTTFSSSRLSVHRA